MPRPRVLVTSAGGKTGIPTTLQLLQKGYPVRAFVHRDDHRARLLRDAGAEIFVGNQYAVADMRRAMQGVQRAYHCAPTAPNGLHFGSVFSVSAAEAGLEHIVLLGQWISQPNHPSLYTRETWLNEQIVTRIAGATVTVINVGWFADNYFMVLEPAAQLGLLTMPLGDGAVKKNAPPSNEDIAAVSVEALIDPAAHAGKTYRPTGPELVSPDEIAAILSQVLNRRVRYRDVPETMFLKALAALRPPGYNEGTVSQLRIYAEEYRRGAFAVGAPTTAVHDLTGREAEDFATIARRYASQRREAKAGLGNRLKAIRNFGKILLTPRPDTDAIERHRDHVLLGESQYCGDNAEWRAGHDPDADARSDRPGGEDGRVSGAIPLDKSPRPKPVLSAKAG